MTNPFQHPAAEDLLERVLVSFKSNSVWLLGHNQLVFVCGGPLSEDSQSVRKKFLNWAVGNIPGFRFFKAEDAAADVTAHDEPRLLNLSQFERVLADVADCIIVIPESVGSWAETGFFSAYPSIQKKCLVVNCVSKQFDSFLNVGPIRSINDVSVYEPTILINFADEVIDFALVAEKLGRYKRVNRARLKFENLEAMDGHKQFAIIHFLISIFPSLDIPSLVKVIGTLFSRYSQPRIRQIVSILVSIGYVRRLPDEELRIYANPEIPPLIEIEGLASEDLLAENLAFFEKYAPEFIPTREQKDAP